MPFEISMPALSPTMTEGTLIKWCKAEGDSIAIGEAIAEIETDKATMEIESIEEGTIGKILVPAGTKGVKVNSVIGVILLKGEDKSALANIVSKTATAPAEPVTVAVMVEAVATDVGAGAVASCESTSAAGGCMTKERIFISPLAKRIATQNNLDLNTIQGSGPRGRIIKSDVMALVNHGDAAPRAIKARQQDSRIAITGLRKAIADKLTEIKRSVPHFYLQMEAHADRMLEMRGDINKAEDSSPSATPKVSVNDLIVKAISLAFRDMPEVNVSWQNDHIAQHGNVDAAVAVSVSGGIFTPIVKNADQKSVFDISTGVKNLAARAKTGALKPDEFLGGSFTVSNLGMYGIDSFTAILNSPQSSIFAIGAARKIPIVRDGQVVVSVVISITASFDHRAIDGELAAKLMSKIKHYIENPFKLLL